jgi:hypothetical protein
LEGKVRNNKTLKKEIMFFIILEIIIKSLLSTLLIWARKTCLARLIIIGITSPVKAKLRKTKEIGYYHMGGGGKPNYFRLNTLCTEGNSVSYHKDSSNETDKACHALFLV